MADYLPVGELTALLPSDHGLSAGQLASCVTAGSADCDSVLAALYRTPFVAYSASPAASPPWPVRSAAAYFSAFHASHIRSALNNLSDDAGEARRLREAALSILNPFAGSAMRPAWQQLAPETATDTLISTSWGDGDPYDSNTAPLSIMSGEYIAGSARFSEETDWKLDIDFRIEYYEPRRKWIITRSDMTIGDGAGTPEDPGDVLTYDVSRLRKREGISPGPETYRVVRA